VNNQFNNPWYFILPNGDLYAWEGRVELLTGNLLGTFGSAAYLNPELVYDAAQFAPPTAQLEQAADLDQQYGFHLDDRGLLQNVLGQGERWLRGKENSFGNNWYYLLPDDGDLFEWDHRFGDLRGNLLATFDAAFYLSPELIHEAFRLDTTI
jgi:hypothetical protein